MVISTIFFRSRRMPRIWDFCGPARLVQGHERGQMADGALVTETLPAQGLHGGK